jgi:hypothetical protein
VRRPDRAREAVLRHDREPLRPGLAQRGIGRDHDQGGVGAEPGLELDLEG